VTVFLIIKNYFMEQKKKLSTVDETKIELNAGANR